MYNDKMPIFPKLGYIFIHVPKTGGSSIEKHFYELEGIEDDELKNVCYGVEHEYDKDYSMQHFTYADLRDVVNLKVDSYNLIFAVVRNPFDRMVSEFHLHYYQLVFKQKYVYKTMEELKQNFEEYCEKVVDGSYNNDNHQLPQYYYVSYNNEIVPTIKILKFETLKTDFESVFGQSLKYHENKSNRPLTCLNHYTEKSRKLVADYYHLDFKYFDYDPNVIPDY